jgi:PAS domain S-box-containing protein
MVHLQVRQQTPALKPIGEMEMFFQLSFDLLCVCGSEGYFTNTNPAWKKVLGWTRAELRSKSWIELVHPLDVEASLGAHTGKSKDVIEFENRYRHKNGSYRWLSWRMTRYQNGCSYAIAQDITEQKNMVAQIKLLRSLTTAINEADNLNSALEATLHQVCETTGWEYSEVWIPNSDGSRIECSPVGYNRLEKLEPFRQISEGLIFSPGVGIPGRVWETKQPEWNQDISIQPLDWILRAKAAKKCGIKAGFGVPILANNKVLAVLIFFTVERRAQQQNLVDLICTIAKQLGSLMQRQQIEESLRVTNQTLQTLIQTSPLGIITLDMNAKGTMWNAAASRLFGWSASEVLGDFIPIIPPQEQQEFRIGWQAHLQDAKPTGLELRRQRKDGSFIDVNLWTAPLHDNLGNIAGGIGMLADISERKKSQTERIQLISIIENSPDIIGLASLEGEVLFINQAGLELVGLNKNEEVKATRIFDYLMPEDRHEYQHKILPQILETGSWIGEYRLRHFQSNKPICVHHKSFLIKDIQTNQPIAIATVSRDIREQKATEIALRESEERLRSVLENMPVMLDALDEEGNIIVWNRECQRVTGYCSQEIVGNPHAWELLYPDESYRKTLLNLWQERGNNYRNWEWEITCKDGSVKTIAWSNIAAKFSIPGWAKWAIGIDVTERKLAKAELQKDNAELESKIAKRTAELWNAHQRAELELIERRKAEQQLKRHVQMIDLANDTIMIRDLTNSITYWNQGAQKLYGWTQEQAIGKSVHALLQTKLPQTLESIYQQLYSTNHWQGELIHTKCDKEQITVASRWTLWHDELGNPSAILEINHDITEQKRTEEEVKKLNADLQRRNVELAAANQELEAFCYSVSHDLRAPLRSINGFSQILAEDYGELLDEMGKDYLQRVRTATGRMGQLIDDLLSLSRITRSTMQFSTVDLSAIASSISLELQSTQPNRCVEFCIQDNIQIQGDPRLLRVALENLLNNAWKYTSNHPQARIEFGVLHHRVEDQDNQAQTLMPNGRCSLPQPVYFVRDDGAGFNMAYAEKLFAPFQRLHGSAEFEGNGIGLATVQRIVRRHGGQIWAEGQVEYGATFYFTLNE